MQTKMKLCAAVYDGMTIIYEIVLQYRGFTTSNRFMTFFYI